jgi:hypothetical protein
METTPPPAAPERRAAPPEPSGWAMFASVVLVIAGSLDAFWGLGAILNDEVVTVGGRGVIVWDFTAWGWIHLILGAILILTALGRLDHAGLGPLDGCRIRQPERHPADRRASRLPIVGFDHHRPGRRHHLRADRALGGAHLRAPRAIGSAGSGHMARRPPPQERRGRAVDGGAIIGAPHG